MPSRRKKRRHALRKGVGPDPLVNPGNPPHRHQACPAANPPRSYHRLVIVAARPSSRSTRRSPQKKYATVMLGLPIVGKLLGHAQLQTTYCYVHLELDPLRRGAEFIGHQLATAMGELATDSGAEYLLELPAGFELIMTPVRDPCSKRITSNFGFLFRWRSESCGSFLPRFVRIARLQRDCR